MLIFSSLLAGVAFGPLVSCQLNDAIRTKDFRSSIHPAVVPRQQTATNATNTAGCTQACAQLDAAFGPEHLHYPDNDNFTIWDAKQQEIRPACRVEPANATEVSSILQVLTDNWCRFAVKGGGHSRNPDDSSSVGGVTIDLGLIVDVEVAADSKSARIGGGADSGQVYEQLDPRNLSFVGGRVGSVGVGGHALGGGTSPFSNRYGWALDNIFEYEIVLANGTISTASETTNSDLYWALRGGGNNFGIVTTFTVKVFPQGELYQASVSYNDSQREEVLDRIYDIWTEPTLSSDLDASYDMAYSYNTTSNTFALSGTQRYARPIVNASVYESLDKIPAVSRNARIGQMSILAGSPPLGVTRNLFGTLTVAPSRELLSYALAVFREEAVLVRDVEGVTPIFITYPIHKTALAAMTQRGGNALGLESQDGPLFLILVSTGWRSAAGDWAIWDMTRNVIDRVKSAALTHGMARDYRYMNYAWAGQADEVFASYGEANAQRLRDIQEGVDPQGVFTRHGLWRGFMKLH